MKRLMLFTLLVFGIFQVQANAPIKSNFTAKSSLVNGKTIQLTLVNLQENFTQISLMDLEEDRTFYSASLKKNNGFSKNLNLEDLKDGKYILCVKSGGVVQKQVIRIKGNMLLLSNFA